MTAASSSSPRHGSSHRSLEVRQIVEAFPNETAPRYLLPDRDAIYDECFTRSTTNMGIREVIIAPRAPWQNAFVSTSFTSGPSLRSTSTEQIAAGQAGRSSSTFSTESPTWSIWEFATEHSLGYNGTDYFSPEMDYAVAATALDPYLAIANRLLTERRRSPLTREDLMSHGNQLKALIDICHVYGLAVILDVVYNHAGGDFGDGSLYFFDRAINRSNNDSLYFTDQGWAGGLVFAFWKQEVRQFLIDNATFYVHELHADGFRYDEVTVIHRFGGWRFCQDLTDTLRFVTPSIPHIAEFWNPDQSGVIKPSREGGAGFDLVWSERLREAIRAVIAQAAAGRNAAVNFDVVRNALGRPPGFQAAWRAVQHLENHDVVYAGHADRQPRIAALGDSMNARSWYARSRARVAMGLLLTAPGIPMLFMGQEFLENKPWSDTPDPATLIFWDGLRTDRAMQDYLRFTQELVWLRRRHPALRGEGIRVFHVNNENRVIPALDGGPGPRCHSRRQPQRVDLPELSPRLSRAGPVVGGFQQATSTTTSSIHKSRGTAGRSAPTARRGRTCRRQPRSSSRQTPSSSSSGTPGIDAALARNESDPGGAEQSRGKACRMQRRVS